MQGNAMERRGFLASLGVGSAVMLAPGVALFGLADARSAGEAAKSSQRWGMLINASLCTHGCDECVSACSRENGFTNYGRPQTDVQWIRKVTIRDRQLGHEFSLPVMCQHCQYPPCVDVCPTGASFRRVDGIVLVDRHICIGCRYCMMACPYKARSFVHESISNQEPHSPRGKGTVESCTLCVHRVSGSEGLSQAPACVDACVARGHNAMVFGDLGDPDSRISIELRKYPGVELRGDMRLEPGIRYSGL
uniref:Prokaryotic molybdopterin-containing oxidoreductase family, iron-sulfur binding subunit n=1 Tax=Candidatus Kentrum sp. MB TaxID=2138164 RepID=A0A450XT75_9GAMM|nr:MAG: prokaryotic molybdopterin-containing oxidoreductase family, iron-sulfur binding subunit [Candidatus Kentron sp. MB]VFK32448.1 MAG: prokaryotic molybdopterin-containing oxidoreductase family, iron-sulfur binding subunit [Candidatus Kentron sp. MB]VFK75915.1 MAG: prokaryotic molybdopterin-containing oxidoreductase family, iron-sulfur binding subunit [Candidatus Kentron sp. MB]